MTDLEPISPNEALRMWIDRCRSTRADETIQSYQYRLNPFLDWCEVQGINNMNDLTSRDIFAYDSHRRSDGLKATTLKTQIGTLKRFIRFCERIDAVESGLTNKIEVPTADLAQRVNDELLTAERAEVIRSNLEKYRRGTREQAMFEILWHTGCRMGGLRGLDIDDFYFEPDHLERLRHQDSIDQSALEAVELPFLYFRHRDETPLKNKEAGERPVGLSETVADRIRDYINVERSERTDENERRPLFTTEKGDTARVSKSGIRREIYILTQPCRFGSCPHDRSTTSCEALEHGREARCPSSRSPHPIRTGAITHMRDEGWPPEVVAERVNATPEVIREHYDHPDPIRRMQSRRQYLEEDSE